MNKLQEIYEGWSSLIKGENKELAEERAKICAICPFNKFNVCSKCGCPLPAKTSGIKSTCPESKWLK